MSGTLRAFVIDEGEAGPRGSLRQIDAAELPDNDVLVQVAYSALNYKDGLAVTGRARIARSLPMVAGIDLAGTVLESRSPQWRPGDQVVANGWGLSEQHWGGYAQRQRVRPEFLLRLPRAFSPRQAMAIGTAGYAAMLCVLALEEGHVPSGGDVLVTGAAGGVGSVAVALLARLGYRVTAATGREDAHAYLRDLGACAVMGREQLAVPAGPLQQQRWAGVVDSVGGHTLANALAQTRYGGIAAACGLAGGHELPGSVLPFIMRGVRLAGIDSVLAAPARRQQAWDRLARDLDPAKLDAMTTVEPMSRLPELAADILAGRIRGRTVIDVNA